MVLSMMLVGCMSLEERLASSDAKIKKDAEIELYQIAVATRNDVDVMKAVNRITSNEVLARIAAHSGENIAQKAVERMNEDQWLFSVASTAKSPLIKQSAASKIKSQKWLLDLYKEIKSQREKTSQKEREEERKIVLQLDKTKRREYFEEKGRLARIVLEKMDYDTLVKAGVPLGSLYAKHWRQIEDAKILARMFKDSIGVLSEDEQKELAAKLVAKGFPVDSLFKYRLNYADEQQAINSEREERDCREKLKQAEARAKAYYEKASRQYLLSRQKASGEAKDIDAEVAELRTKLKILGDKRKLAPTELFVENSRLREILCATVCEKMSDEDVVKGITGHFKMIKKMHSYSSAEEKTKIWVAFARCAKELNLKTVEARQDLFAEMVEEINPHYQSDAVKAWVEVVGEETLTQYLTSKQCTRNVEMLKLLFHEINDGKNALALYKRRNVGARKILASRLSPEDITAELYSKETDFEVREILASRAPHISGKLAELDKKRFEKLIKDGETNERHVLAGFYLGMHVDDAMALLKYYFPNEKFFLDPQVWAFHCDGIFMNDALEMPVCRKKRDGKVWQLNFTKAMLRKLKNYDVQTYGEWAAAYGKEHNINMRFKRISGTLKYTKELVINSGGVRERTAHESFWGMNGANTHSVERSMHVIQETYQYRNNMKGYTITFFGEIPDLKEVKQRVWREWVVSDRGMGAEEGTLRFEITED